jgi:hypothetical protein
MNKTIKTASVVVGFLLLIAGILLIVFKPNVQLAYPLSLIGIGGYLFAIGLSSLLLSRMFYQDTSEESAARNRLVRLFEIVVYSFIGIIVLVSVVLYFTVL